MSQNKGKRAEREVVKLLQPIVDRVYADFELGDSPILQRNTLQSDRGGYDIVGLDWIAIEVKHHATLSLNPWWEQTVAQAKPGQCPTLFFRTNNVKWKVMLTTGLWTGDGYVGMRSIVTIDDYLIYFERRLRWEVAGDCIS